MSRAGGHPKNGGIAARRAVIRWAVRLFRREWRQQVLILTLLVAAVAAAVLGTAMAHGFAPSRDAVFGKADATVVLQSQDTDLLDERLESAREWFGPVEVIDRMVVEVPGITDTYELRAQDPDAALGAPMLDLLEGRYPSDDDEVALTDEMATIFGAEVGEELEAGGQTWDVVGMVENPAELEEEFGLVAPGAIAQPDPRVLLVDADFDRLRDWPPAEDNAVREYFEMRGETEKMTAAVVALGIAAIAMLLVSLLAAAGFVVVAQRRQRQIGLLAATGATSKHLRLVMLANGLAVGLVATAVGTAGGLLGWILLAPGMEEPAGHRLDALDVPWWVILTAAVLAVVSAAAASWWPARAVARLPVTAALSGRPPAPKRARRTAIPAFVLLAAGVGAIVWADPNWYLGDEISRPTHDMALIAGVIAISIGVLLACPLAVRLLATVAGRLPLAPRLAVRDLSRYRARSGAALAALSLALGIPVAIVITGSATAKQSDEGSLSDRQMLIRIGDANDLGAPFGVAVTPSGLDEMQQAVDEFAAEWLDEDDAVVPTDVAYDPALRAETPDASEIELVAVGRPIEDGYRDLPLAVATPALLEHYGVDPADIPAGTDVLTTHTEELVILGLSQAPGSNVRRAPVAENPMPIDVPAYSNAPNTLITDEAIAEYGLETVQSGWLVETRSPLTVDQVAAARQVAIDSGLTIATRPDYGYSSASAASLLVGMALALAIVMMTVGLIRSESTEDLRTLAATGAARGIRRALTASTAGALGLLGVLCGGFGAYLALTSGYIRTPSLLLERMPVQELLILGFGMPLLAAGVGWLLGGQEPPSLVRPRLPLASVAVLLALALTATAACGGDDDGGEGGGGAGGGGETVNPEDRAPLPLEEFENAILGDDEARLEQERRVEQRTADCMAGLGFEYVPVEPPPATASGLAPDSPWSLPSDEFAERYGYGLFTIDDPALSDPNAAIVQAMSESERSAYSEALQGPSDGGEEVDVGPADDEAAGAAAEAEPEEEQEPEMGCLDQSWQAEFEMALLSSEDFASLSEDLDALFQRQEADPRVEDAAREWADCMADEDPDYADFEIPDDAVDSVNREFVDLGGDQNEYVGMESWEIGNRTVHRMRGIDLTAIDPEVRRQLQDYEIAVATADFQCRADYDEVSYDVRREYEEEFVEEHQAELDRFLEAFTAAQDGGAGDEGG